MTAARDFSTVMADVIAKIPEDEPALRMALAAVQAKAAKHAPELVWQMVAPDAQYLIGIHTPVKGEATPEWWGRVLAAWTGSA